MKQMEKFINWLFKRREEKGELEEQISPIEKQTKLKDFSDEITKHKNCLKEHLIDFDVLYVKSVRWVEMYISNCLENQSDYPFDSYGRIRVRLKSEDLLTYCLGKEEKINDLIVKRLYRALIRQIENSGYLVNSSLYSYSGKNYYFELELIID